MKRGFTIVEVIVVISVLAILTAIVMVAATAAENESSKSEGQSELSVIKSALENYYSVNNEYPAASLLANGGDGRNLTAAQYELMATTLGVKVDVLTGGRYKFVPCANGSNLCCTNNAQGECALNADVTHIYYLTRSTSDVAASPNPERRYEGPSSGCWYTFPASTNAQETGYSAYFLTYFDPTDTDWWTKWRIYTSDRGNHGREAWCHWNRFD